MRKAKYFHDLSASLKRHVGLEDVPQSEITRRTTLPSLRELPTAALDLYKLELVARDPDLKGIDYVEQENEWVHRLRQEVHSKATQMLARGLETQNQVEVANALQVFTNLRALDATVKQTIANIEEKLLSSIRGVLDFSALRTCHWRMHKSVL